MNELFGIEFIIFVAFLHSGMKGFGSHVFEEEDKTVAHNK